MPRGHDYLMVDDVLPQRKQNRRVWVVTVVSCLLVGVALGFVINQQTNRLSASKAVLDMSLNTWNYQYLPSMLPRPLPDACHGWEARCLDAGAKAQTAGLGKYWNSAACSEENSGKFSCANRAKVWRAPSIYLPPSRITEVDDREITDNLTSAALFLFLPGTGTPPEKVRTLLGAAADMGYHALGLTYASQPVAVSMNDVWCTSRDSVHPSDCNAQTHTTVLFGTPTGAAGGGLWDVKADESVQHLLEASLSRLGWTQFLDNGGSVRWDSVVVSGHSQGASHAAYLSTQRPVRGAVLFSGPQECGPCAHDWLKDYTGDKPPPRRAVYEIDEECGDEPEEGPEQSSLCAEVHPQTLPNNLRAMGLKPGYIGKSESGYIAVDFDPLVSHGRNQHNSMALVEAAPPAVKALWKALVAEM